MTPPIEVAIVGGGFAGALTALNALEAMPGARVVLVTSQVPAGPGLAYGPRSVGHWLNVRASEMSALPQDPAHLVRWLEQQGGGLGGQDYLPRALYGRYLSELLAGQGSRLELRVDTAIALWPTPAGYALRLACGEVLEAHQVVLAVGQAPPPALRAAAGLGPEAPYVPDPWSEAAMAPLPPGAAVLLVGTGLTAVDLALGLVEAGAGHVEMVSRRARLPLPAYDGPGYPDWLAVEAAPPRAAALFRLARREVAGTSADWRAVIDALRPHAPALWARLSLVERRRFLRHGRGPWDAARNRLPPEAARRIAAFEAAGRVQLTAARLRTLEPSRAGLAAHLTLPSGAMARREVARVINCTGPELHYRRGAQPLLQAVLGTGLARLDPLGLGLDVAADFSLLDEDGMPSPGLYALGAPSKGRFFEVAAVSALREHARLVSLRLAAARRARPAPRRSP